MAVDNTGDQVRAGAEQITTKENIKEFLGLNNAPPLSAELQQKLGHKLIPWWLDEGNLDFGNQGVAKGPFDPVSVILAELKQNPTHDIAEQPLIYPVEVDLGGNKIVVLPRAELVDAATEYLHKIGFQPPKPIRGKNWLIPEPKRKLYPTAYENIQVEVTRDKIGGKTEAVSLVAFKHRNYK